MLTIFCIDSNAGSRCRTYYCTVDRWTRHLATPDMDEQNNCTESSYFLTCKMTMRDVQLLHRDRRCLLNADVVDTCDLEVRHRNSDRVATLDAIYCKIYSLLVQFKGVVYKNPHCAACNGVKINDTSCLETKTKGNHSGDLRKILLIPIFKFLGFEKLSRKFIFIFFRWSPLFYFLFSTFLWNFFLC